MNPGAAYLCHECPLPSADPGAELRAVVKLFETVTSEGGQSASPTMMRVLAELDDDPDAIELLQSDFAVIGDRLGRHLSASRPRGKGAPQPSGPPQKNRPRKRARVRKR